MQLPKTPFKQLLEIDSPDEEILEGCRYKEEPILTLYLAHSTTTRVNCSRQRRERIVLSDSNGPEAPQRGAHVSTADALDTTKT